MQGEAISAKPVHLKKHPFLDTEANSKLSPQKNSRLHTNPHRIDLRVRYDLQSTLNLPLAHWKNSFLKLPKSCTHSISRKPSFCFLHLGDVTAEHKRHLKYLVQKPYDHQYRHFTLALVLVPPAQLKKAIYQRDPGIQGWDRSHQIHRLYSTGVGMDPKVSVLVTQADPGSLNP